jgi:hypothetical protein
MCVKIGGCRRTHEVEVVSLHCTTVLVHYHLISTQCHQITSKEICVFVSAEYGSGGTKVRATLWLWPSCWEAPEVLQSIPVKDSGVPIWCLSPRM